MGKISLKVYNSGELQKNNNYKLNQELTGNAPISYKYY